MVDLGTLMQGFQAGIEASPLWVQVWINFMGVVHLLALPFLFSRREAWAAVVAMLLVFPTMMFLYAQFGFQRILGLAHILFWTPVLWWLWQRRDQWRVKNTLSGKWIALYAATIFTSLLMDYADVVRYLLGERM